MKQLLNLGLTLGVLTGCVAEHQQFDQKQFEVVTSKAIIGSQDGRRLLPANRVDASTVAILRGAENVVCTGTTIGISHVITAAHCVYDNDLKKYKDGISIIPGLHLAKGEKKGNRYFIKRIMIPKNYIKDVGWNGYTSYSSSKDIAILQIKEYQGNTFYSDESPSIELGDPSDFKYNGFEFNMIAYHSDTAPGSQYAMVPCHTKGQRYHYTAAHHDCDTMPSASGAPIVGQQDKLLYAIHTGKSGTGDYNTSAIITSDLSADIEKIRLFEFDDLEKFDVHQVQQETYNTASIKSNCHKPIYARFAYEDQNGGLKSTHEEMIPANGLKLFSVRTQKDQVHLYAKTSDESHIWDGSYTLTFKDGTDVDFMTLDLKTYRGDTKFILNCD